MKNKFSPFIQLLFGALLVIGGIFAAMYVCYLPFRLSIGESFTLMDMYFPDTPPETVPSRNVLEMNNLELLWIEEMDIDNPHQVYVELLVPNEESFVFWSPQSASLMALEFTTGNVLWETAVPYVSDIGLYNGHFYISSSDWLDRLERAPKDTDGSFNNCSFAGQAALVAIDATTGYRIWGYSYWGSSGNGFSISENNIYLTGSNDHGASRSVVRIDAANGAILERDCYQWPYDEEKELTSAPADESQNISPYLVVLEENRERELSRKIFRLFFVAEGNQLDILDGQTKEVVGSVHFEGAALNSCDIDVAVQGDIAVIYFGDSHQLMGFRLPDEASK
jgi:hypothetical protein